MTYEEMGQITHEELSHFTHGELSLYNIELLIKILENDDIVLPQSIIDKLYSICSKTISSLERLNIAVPKEIRDITLHPLSKSLLSKFMIFIRDFVISTGVLLSLSGTIDATISKESIATTSYTTQNELNYDVSTTIESIKTIWDFSVNFSDFEATLSPKKSN